MTPRALVAPGRLGHSFPNGIQQDLTCERLAQIGDAPGVHRLIARGLVVVRRHEDDRALRSRCRKSALQLDPRNSAEVDVEQQAGCRLRAAALNQRLGRGERTAVDAVVRQQSRHALQKARIVIDHDHDCRLRYHIRVQLRVRMGPGCRPTLDLDQRNLVRCEQCGLASVRRELYRCASRCGSLIG